MEQSMRLSGLQALSHWRDYSLLGDGLSHWEGAAPPSGPFDTLQAELPQLTLG